MSHLPIEAWVRAARVYASEQAAWLAPALYAAPLCLSERLPTPAAIDKHGRVYFNPRWIAQIYKQVGQDKQKLVQQLGFLWYHEVMHWLRQHGERAEAIRAEPELWNLACDMEINDYLPEGLAYPDFGGAFKVVFPQDYGFDEGHTAEWYYRRLQEQLRLPITIIPCDAVPYEAIQVMRGSDWLKVREGLRGGGGTDMVAGLQAALALTPKPNAVIVPTDGHTPYPTECPKDTVVVWALWQYGDAEPPHPPMPPWHKRDVVVIPIE